MPHFIVEKVQNALNDQGKALKGSRIHILGVAYKRDIDDVRESPALDVINLLKRRGAEVTFSDPYVPSIRIDGDIQFSTDLLPSLRQADCAVIITNHRCVDYATVVEESSMVVDARNALRGLASPKIIRL